MTTYMHLVFSDPPDGVPDAEYDTWYDRHVEEILAVEGWVAATRYHLTPEVGADVSGGYRFLSVYELDCEPTVAVANLAAAGMGNADSYVELKGADPTDADAPGDGPLPLPDWFAGIRFASWNATAAGPRITPAS